MLRGVFMYVPGTLTSTVRYYLGDRRGEAGEALPSRELDVVRRWGRATV